VFLSVVLLALTLPADIVLLKALQQPDTTQAVREWVAEQDATSLTAAASRIEAYPAVYRKEIMRALDPAGRSRTWRAHVQRYIDQQPDAGADAIAALKAAQSALTPDALSEPTESSRSALTAAAEQVVSLLGKETAIELLADLGPRDVRASASAEPWGMRLTNFVRNRVALLARQYPCECAV
jgi:hypothetical protein